MHVVKKNISKNIFFDILQISEEDSTSKNVLTTIAFFQTTPTLFDNDFRKWF